MPQPVASTGEMLDRTGSQRQFFQLSGRVQATRLDKAGRCKRLHLETGGRIERIKLAKPLRSRLGTGPIVGSWVALAGTAKRHPQTGRLKLKAQTLSLSRVRPTGRWGAVLPTSSIVPPPTPARPPIDRPAAQAPSAKILVCQKANCRKRGGDGLCQAIAQTLAAKGLGDRVKVQPTGCLKECNRGPAIVTLPDKTRHTRIQPDQIPALIETHFSP